MAYFYRVGAYLVSVFTLCFAFASPARALSAEYDWTLLSNNGYTLGVVRGYDAACAAVTARYLQGGSCLPNGPGQIDYITSGNYRYYGGAVRQNVPYEPANSTCSADSCICKVGYTLNATASACMVKPSVATAGACVTVCYNGSCSADVSCGASLVGPYGSTPNTPNDCGPGLAYGSVNGLKVCVKPDYTSFGKYSSVTTSVTGSVSTASAGAGAASGGVSPGGVATSEQTVCTGGRCNTEITTTTSSPGVSDSIVKQSKTEAADDFCTKFPRSPGCSDSSFTGGCGSFSGTGDALAVATARAVSDSKCALETLKGTEGYGAPALAAAGVDRPSDSPVNNKQIIDLASMINKGNPFGESCVPDYPINVPKVGQIVIPLTAYCSVLAYLGKLLVGMSMLVGASIVAKRDA